MCENLEEGESCALNAICSVEGDCVCKKGFFVITDFLVNNDGDDCKGNVAGIQFIYILLTLMAVISVVIQGAAIKKKSQFMRFIPFIVLSLIYFSAGIAKASFPTTKVFGEDVLLTVFAAISPFFITFSSAIILMRFVQLFERLDAFRALIKCRKAKNQRYVTYLALGSVSLSTILLLSVFGASVDAIKKFYRAGMFFFFVALSFTMFPMVECSIALERLIKAREIKGNKSLRTRTIRVLQANMVGTMISNLLIFSTVVSDNSSEVLVYIYPVGGIIFYIISFMIVINFKNGLKNLKYKSPGIFSSSVMRKAKKSKVIFGKSLFFTKESSNNQLNRPPENTDAELNMTNLL